jgi:hypothetical protein
MSHRIRGAAAVHLQLAPRLGLQLADRGRDVIGQHRRVVPLGLVSVLDATYLGFVFRASAMAFLVN